MKNPNEHIGNRARGLPACITVSRPNVPPRIKFKIAVTEVFGSVRLRRLGLPHNISDSASSHVIGWNEKRGGPAPLGLLASAITWN